MNTIKWGIIGTGSIASKFAEVLKSLDDAELLAVASRRQDSADAFADKFGIERAYGSYEELGKDSDLDVVYIATPHSEHKDNAAMCIKNGKAVLCEKPFTLNQAEAKYLISLAKEHKVFLMEAMWTKFMPTTFQVKKWIKEKRIGKVKHIRANFGYYNEFDLNSRLFDPKIAGGALLDAGIYPITYAVHMLEKMPKGITSSAVMGKSQVDEQNVVILDFEDGVLADLSSAITAEIGKDAVIIGEKGKIIIPNFFFAQAAELYDAEGKLVDSFEEPFITNGYEYEAMEVNRCLQEGKLESAILPLKDTLDIIKIMDEIRAQWGFVYPQEVN